MGGLNTLLSPLNVEVLIYIVYVRVKIYQTKILGMDTAHPQLTGEFRSMLTFPTYARWPCSLTMSTKSYNIMMV